MRVIGGIAKGKKLKVPKGYKTRPTSDRVKEALFSILGNTVVGAYALDLYAGTGSLGIEALSRGAEFVVFVEKEKLCAKVLTENLNYTGFSRKARVVRSEVLHALRNLQNDKLQFNLIFLDPPYKIDLASLQEVFKALREGNFLKPDGVLVWEHSSKVTPVEVEGFQLIETRIYGDTALSFYKITEGSCESSGLSGKL